MNQSWNAEEYSSGFSFVHQYGNEVLDLIEGGGSALDLGCGNGALTKALADRGFSATGLDASEEMLERARRDYPDIPFIRADASDFALDRAVDVVFSNAMLHWIDRERQPAALGCVSRALRPGGEFVLEMGGFGNNRLIHAALASVFARHGHGYAMPFYFPSIGEYASLTEAAGLRVRHAFLFDRPTPLKGGDGLAGWMRMFLQNPFAGIGEEEKEGMIREAVELLRPDLFREGVWISDYVRLRMRAVKE